MSGSRRRRVALAAASLLAIAALLGSGAGAQPPAPGEVSFAVPSLFPTFDPSVHDYVVRCHDRPVSVNAHVADPWEAAIANHPYRSGDYSVGVRLSTGRAFTIRVRDTLGQHLVNRYHVRCLPDDFPKYTYTRSGAVSPQYFSAGSAYLHYGIIFDDHGVPVWWYHTGAQGTRVLPNGNVLWANHAFSPPRWEIHRLDGSMVRTLDAVGHPANSHDLQLLGNGDYLAGAYVRQSHVDTSAYGGSSDATVVNADLQQVSPAGDLVWDWRSRDHISLAETGRHWPWAVNHGYDIAHWNSIEPAGQSVIASFRNVDAVYKIRKSTGDVVWKLGGTKTPESLAVKNDPDAPTLGSQHDARLLPDGTVTVFDNRSNATPARPRAVRFSIDEQNRTATLLESISDPDVPGSGCCGSARRLSNGDWLIDWGGDNPIGGYKADGERTFLLTFDSSYSYRAEPVPAGVVSGQDLRQGMNAMYPGG